MKKKIVNISLMLLTILSFIISIVIYVYNESKEPYYIYINNESYKTINDFDDLNKMIEQKLNKQINDLFVSNPSIIKVDDNLRIIDLNIELSYSDKIWKYIIQIQKNDDDYVIIVSKTRVKSVLNEEKSIKYLNVANVISFFDYSNITSYFTIMISTTISYEISNDLQVDTYYFDGQNVTEVNNSISGVFCHINVIIDDKPNKIIYFLK